MTAIKICGIQPGDDLSFVQSLSVTHVGFVLVPQSRRYVEPPAIRKLVEQISDSATTVGVFVNTRIPEVEATMETAGLDIAQLHGAESPLDCQTLREHGRKVWKSVSVPREDVDVQAIAGQILEYAPHVDGLLLDAAAPKNAGNVSGGHGLTWDWTVLQHILDAVGDERIPPIWIAGGIRPDNAGALLAGLAPYGLDVSSGVEENGRKSSEKIRQLVKVVTRSE